MSAKNCSYKVRKNVAFIKILCEGKIMEDYVEKI